LRETLRKKFAGAISAEALAAKTAAVAGRIPTARKLAAAEKARKSASDADAALASLFVSDDGEWRRRLTDDEEKAAAERALLTRQVLSVYDKERDAAALDKEEAGESNIAGTVPFLPPRLSDLAPEARNHHAVYRFLPPELAEFLSYMRPVRRAEREKAILKKVEWLGLEVLAMPPAALAERAEREARRHAAQF